MNPTDNVVVRVGTVLELRRSRRSMNRVGLTKLARKLFAAGPGDIIFVGTDTVIDRLRVPLGRVAGLSAG